jgi:hypothetical protein
MTVAVYFHVRTQKSSSTNAHTATVTQNAAAVAANLPKEVLLAAAAPHIARSQTPHAGPGRPKVLRCPGCDELMSTAELREHRVPCLHEHLSKLTRRHIRLTPKDPDPYPDFFLSRVDETKACFEKLSSHQQLIIDVSKIAELTSDSTQDRTFIRVLGRVAWDDGAKLWRFMPSRIGRPPGESL